MFGFKSKEQREAERIQRQAEYLAKLDKFIEGFGTPKTREDINKAKDLICQYTVHRAKVALDRGFVFVPNIFSDYIYLTSRYNQIYKADIEVIEAKERILQDYNNFVADRPEVLDKLKQLVGDSQ